MTQQERIRAIKGLIEAIKALDVCTDFVGKDDVNKWLRWALKETSEKTYRAASE
jgi:hypothetical protein